MKDLKKEVEDVRNEEELKDLLKQKDDIIKVRRRFGLLSIILGDYLKHLDDYITSLENKKKDEENKEN